MSISRNIEKNTVYLSKFWTGLVTNRALIYTPISAMGIQMIQRMDVMAGGLNMELSNQMTLVRRPGFPQFCTAVWGSSDFPQNFHSFINLSGALKLLVDTQTAVSTCTTSAHASIFAKSTSNPSRFQTVGNQVYWCDGTSAQKYDQTTVTNWGIATPVTAPTITLGGGSLSPKAGYRYVYVYRNPNTKHISTASPFSGTTGPQTSQQFTVQGASSADAQATKVDIYRTLDGGSIYYFLAEVNNGGTWSYTDNVADSGLTTSLVAPLANQNDPPPAGVNNVCFWQNRLWVSYGNNVAFAAGPDCTNGVGQESFPPANVFVFPTKVTALAPTSKGLLVFTVDDIFLILGQDSSSFYSMMWQFNYGVQSQDCVSLDGDSIFIFTSKRQLYELSAASGITELGFNIADQLVNFNPTTTFVAVHRSGADAGLFISDGSANIFKYNFAFTAWSPVAQLAGSGGVSCIKSIETSIGNWTLLAGRAAFSSFILGRNPSVFTDDAGSTYDAFSTIGCIVLSPPGETATMSGTILERSSAGTDPTLSVLLNEVSGTFVALPNPVQDPPLLLASTSIIMKRFYLKAAMSPLPQQVRFVQVKMDFGTQTVKNEVYGLGIVP